MLTQSVVDCTSYHYLSACVSLHRHCCPLCTPLDWRSDCSVIVWHHRILLVETIVQDYIAMSRKKGVSSASFKWVVNNHFGGGWGFRCLFWQVRSDKRSQRQRMKQIDQDREKEFEWKYSVSCSTWLRWDTCNLNWSLNSTRHQTKQTKSSILVFWIKSTHWINL